MDKIWTYCNENNWLITLENDNILFKKGDITYSAGFIIGMNIDKIYNTLIEMDKEEEQGVFPF